MKEMQIIGNVGKDPVQKATQDGKTFVTFSVAINIPTKSKEKKTQWVEIACDSEKEGLYNLISNHVKVGDKILCRGFPSPYGYVDKENQVVVNERIFPNQIELLSSKKSDDSDAV